MVDMRVKLFGGDHRLVGVVGVVNILVWSIGFVALICVAIFRKSKHLRNFTTLRAFGYFYNGFELEYFWWELLVKRMDVLCCYIVNYTHFVYDMKAELILYMGIAGFFWAVHNRAMPFDARAHGLVHRLEAEGLRTRFVTLFLVQILLVANCPMYVNFPASILLMYCLLYTSPSPRDRQKSRMPSSA